MWNPNYPSGYPQYPQQQFPQQFPQYPQTQPQYAPPQYVQPQVPPQSGMYAQNPYQQPPVFAPSGMNPNSNFNGYNQVPMQTQMPAQNLPPMNQSPYNTPYVAPQSVPPQPSYISNPPMPVSQPSYSTVPPSQPFPTQSAPTRKALLIGINYFNDPSISLKGPISDVQRMKQFLLTRGFVDSPNTMVCLTDDQQNPNFQPIKVNILNAFNWLIGGTKPGDSLFFLYSGHGGQVQDTNHDEVDGMDETILPVDYKSKGVIVDDQIHDYLVKPLPYGAKFTAIMDCCHSGTGMDLPFVYNLNTYNPEFQSLDSRKQSVGDIVLFSGCRDDQCSVDTTVTGMYGRSSGGAMTTAFLEAMQKLMNPSYLQILQSMRNTLRSYCQIPQLSSGKPMDMNQAFLI